jgi:hypothetical protein
MMRAEAQNTHYGTFSSQRINGYGPALSRHSTTGELSSDFSSVLGGIGIRTTVQPREIRHVADLFVLERYAAIDFSVWSAHTRSVASSESRDSSIPVMHTIACAWSRAHHSRIRAGLAGVSGILPA